MQDKKTQQQKQASGTPSAETTGPGAELASRRSLSALADGNDEGRGNDERREAQCEAQCEAQGVDDHSEAPDELRAQVTTLQAELAQAQEALALSERRLLLDRALTEAGAIDVPAAHLLIEQMPEPAGEPAEVVAELKARKPYLFRSPPPAPRSPTMAPRPGTSRSPVIDAAYSAMSTGKRTELLHYMRLKRNGARAALV